MKILRVFFGVIIIFCLCFTSVFGAEKIKKAGEMEIKENAEEKVILTVWQIDSFEGGVGSRRRFLESVAKNFEKKNPNVLFLVLGYTEEGAKESINSGVFPDIISYGNGVFPAGAVELDVNNKFKGAMVGEKVYASVWARGGYVLIENKNYANKNTDQSEIAVSVGPFTQPIVALIEEGIENKKINPLKPLDAYVRFVSGKCKYLLGTQRDICRLESRDITYSATPICKFNDLYQYISVTSKDNYKREKAKEFINYLTSKEVQKDLNKICMMSNNFAVEFENETLNEMQKVGRNFLTFSGFTDKESLVQLQASSIKAYHGSIEEKNKIKNMLI